MTVPDLLDARFRSAAVAEALLDVAYDIVDSPIGPLFLAASRRGICRISYESKAEAHTEQLARAFGLRVLRVPLDEPRRELDEYFEGRRQAFDVSVDLRPLPAFAQAVLAELARVPYGETTTYGALAATTGRPRAARAVGRVMNRNPIPIVLPCHRVLGSSGKLVGYAGGLHRKESLLRLEGAIL